MLGNLSACASDSIGVQFKHGHWDSGKLPINPQERFLLAKVPSLSHKILTLLILWKKQGHPSCDPQAISLDFSGKSTSVRGKRFPGADCEDKMGLHHLPGPVSSWLCLRGFSEASPLQEGLTPPSSLSSL